MTLVLIWTLIFVVFGIALVVILHGVKKSLDKINNILSNAEEFSGNVARAGTPLKFLGSVVEGFMNRGKKSSKK